MGGVFRKLRIAFSVVCGIVCLLLLALWVRSYWSFDVFRWRLSTTTAVQCASTNGQLLLIAFPSRASLGWSWSSITDASMEQDPGFAQWQKEHQTLLTLLKTQLATSDRPQGYAALAARINELNVEWGELRLMVKEHAIARMWAIQSGLQFFDGFQQVYQQVPNRWGFGTRRLASGRAIASPHWCPVLISGAIAVACGIRRWWRFSLRTLLVAMTVVATVLGMVAVANR
jgi:hypothetical protein